MPAIFNGATFDAATFGSKKSRYKYLDVWCASLHGGKYLLFKVRLSFVSDTGCKYTTDNFLAESTVPGFEGKYTAGVRGLPFSRSVLLFSRFGGRYSVGGNVCGLLAGSVLGGRYSVGGTVCGLLTGSVLGGRYSVGGTGTGLLLGSRLGGRYSLGRVGTVLTATPLFGGIFSFDDRRLLLAVVAPSGESNRAPAINL